jgi:hypothetical protein
MVEHEIKKWEGGGNRAERIESRTKQQAELEAHHDEERQLQDEAIRKRTFDSPLELVLQLECHERLHRKYASGTLSRCLLLNYLEFMKEHRWALLDWLGSLMTPEDKKGTCTEPPEIPLRLHKIPPGRQILGDKGFDKADRFFPNMNPVRTPLLLRSRTVKQYLRDQIFGEEGNKSLCRLRYTSEVAYSRATAADSLKDAIHYSNMCLLQHMHSWGHGRMNLYKPLREPAS